MNTRELIERASQAVGSQRKLASMLETAPVNLIQMKQGTRPCNWKTRGKLRQILGEDPAQAFIAAVVEDLEQSSNAMENRAAKRVKTVLTAMSKLSHQP
jgi:hypothetical protein